MRPSASTRSATCSAARTTAPGTRPGTTGSALRASTVHPTAPMLGRQDYRSRDEARNNRLVALLVFGEGWHNNHHAFPASARHGLDRLQIDMSWWVIRGLERLGLVWDV